MINRSLRVLSLFGVWALCASIGFAQESQQPDAAGSQQIQEETMPAAVSEVPAATAPPIEEIVVTGSRIRRDAFTSASPVQVITTETSALAGLLDTAEILQGSTAASGQQIDDSFSGFVTDGGPGSLSVSLRGFGEQRTLVLVNGKRWGPSGVRGATNSVDLTAIPSTVISRYEILKDGASSVYGADAVAGVINAITRKRFDGFQVSAETLLPEEGGAESYVVDATWGKVGSDWSFNIAAGYDKRVEMVPSDRGYSECPQRPRYTDQDGDGVVDNTNPETGEPLCYGFIYGFVVSPFGWVRHEPSLSTPDPGNPYFSGPQQFGIPYYTRVPPHGWKPGTDPADEEPAWDNEGQFYRDERERDFETFFPERELISITSFGDKDFDIGGRSANAYYELYYNHRSTEFSGYRQFFPAVPASNPTNPFGVHGPLGAILGRGFTVLPVLPSYDLTSNTNKVSVDRVNFFLGLDGDISESWSYSTYAGYSWSKGDYTNPSFIADRVAASLNATLDANGNLVCADNSIPDCVPADLFTEDAMLRGQLPADVLAFIARDIEGDTTYKSIQFSGYVTGRLFEFPNGEDVMAVLGFEIRNEDINDVPDIDAQNDNLWGLTSSGITTGDDTVKEFFSELEVPLLKQVPLAEEMVFNGSVRWTDYDSYGDDITYRLALDHQVISSVRMRGTYGTSFRAPDLFEQFLANQTGFANGFLDPCITYGDQFDPDDVVYQNCAAEGLPPDLGADGVPSIRNVIGGNPELKAETSDSWTAGVVFQPEELGISLAYTWWELDLKNTVEDPSTSYILGVCYGSQGRTHAFCERIAPRGDDGFLTDIDASLLNVGLQVARGADFDFRYEKEFSRFDLTIDGTATRLVSQRTQLFDDEWDSVGNWGFPKWVGEVDFRVDWRDWTFFWRARMVGKSHEDPVFDPGTADRDRPTSTDNEWFHSASVRYQNADWVVLATLRNVFDNQPPLVADGVGSESATRFGSLNTIPGAGYDLLGRSLVLQVAREF